MAKRPKITITVTGRRGEHPCHRGHHEGQVFDFDTQRGEICPMAMHCAFPYIDILRYGGTLPGQPEGEAEFCCSDADTIMVFRAQIVEEAAKTPGKEEGEKQPGPAVAEKKYVITDDCIGCAMCLTVCPGICIDNSLVPFAIDPDRCQRCGACIDICPADAIVIE